MIKFLAVILVCLVGVGAMFFDWNKAPQAHVEFNTAHSRDLIENVSLRTMDGRSFNLHEMKEPVILLHFWATWCAPCVTEFPLLIELLEAMDGQVAMVAVSMDYKLDPLERFKAQFERPDLPIYWVHDNDFKLTTKHFKVKQAPETYLIGPDRRIDGKIIGQYDWASDEIRQKLTLLRVGTTSR